MSRINRKVMFLKRSANQTEVGYIDQPVHYYTESPEKLLDEWLIMFGACIKTRKEAARRQLQTSQFLPIIVDAEWKVVFFPLHRTSDYERLYINSRFFLRAEGNDLSQIYFTNHEIIDWACSPQLIYRQYYRSLALIDTQQKIREQYRDDY